MMESGLKDDPARPAILVVEDLRRNLSTEFDCSDLQDSSDLKEHLKVYLRIRPFSAVEIENGESQDCVTIQRPDTVLLKPPQTSLSARLSDKSVPVTAQRFQFSQVYGPDTTQKDIFDGTVNGLVRNVLEGQNSLVFTYGVTNAGKTFTFLGPDTNPGILPRSLNMIFSSLEGRIFTQMCLKPQRCRDFIRLTKEQQNEEAASKRNLLKLFKESDAQRNISGHCSKSDIEDGSMLSDVNSAVLDVEMDMHTRFSIWVSFCEIYNENIHDLLEQHASNASRKTNLRLCQDVKGNSFIKDLKWVQVSSAEEALKVMKLGKRNQSISSTKLNLLSSRSHSIFSVRILKVEDVGIPRVESVSELALCDLAGSERCAKTQNKGERLKEAGNINTSLLSLGKCINALRNNQQARQHVPFRESKLTHYLQGYFTGRGSACMIVNINQCSSMYDETLNVLKFSAVAQKVVVLTTKNIPVGVKRSAREVSFIINNADCREMRRSSLVRWDPSLEDVQEDSDTEDEYEDQSEIEDTILNSEDECTETVQINKKLYEGQQRLIVNTQQQLTAVQAELLTLEARVRDEVTKEFSELISQMQEDYSERMSRERELVEERCERRLEILKNLVEKTAMEDDRMNSTVAKSEEEKRVSLDSLFDSMSGDLAGIRNDAQAAQSCLVTSDPRVSATLHDLEKKVTELSEQLSISQNQLLLKTKELETQSRLSDELEETLESHREREFNLSDMCRQKDEMIAKLQATLDQHVERKAEDRAQMDSVQKKVIQCCCTIKEPLSSRNETRKRRQEGEGLEGQPPLKKGPPEDLKMPEDEADDGREDSALLEVKGQLECCLAEAKQKDKQITDLEQECHRLQVCIQDQKSNLDERVSQEHILKEDVCQTTLESKQMATAVDFSNLNVAVASRCSNTTGAFAAKSLMAKRDLELREKNKHILTLEKEIALMRQKAEHTSDYENLKKLNSELQAEVKSLCKVKAELKEKITCLQKEKEGLEDKEVGLTNPNTLGFKSKERDNQTHLMLSGKEAEIALRENALTLKETQLSALQKSLKQTQERLEEEEMQAVQEARRKEVERRREILAVAEEAIAQKDAELQKRQEEISRLKEEIKTSECKMSSLTVDLRRREDDSSDLREKLCDSKKQIQQVQKEISSMREAEKSLRLKLSDLEKTKVQLQNEIANRDRTINQLKAERSSGSKSDENLLLYQKACKDLQERERVIEDMRLALTEQEETQTQLDLELDNRNARIDELTQELASLREMLPEERDRSDSRPISKDVLQARQQITQAHESLQLANEKQQAERKKWMEEKLILIGQAKEAEERRNQDMRRFADDRERHVRQQAEMESLAARLNAREEEMERWRKERDTLVSALEVQLKKLIMSNGEKDQQIKMLQSSNTAQTPEEVSEDSRTEALQAELAVKEAEIQKLKEQLSLSATNSSIRRNSTTQTMEVEFSDMKPLNSSTIKHKSRTRGSVISQNSSGSGPLVLDSSEISTETGRRSRFPRPELEISFSPLQPDRFALKRQGEESAVTVKISRPTRKRKSGEMDKRKGARSSAVKKKAFSEPNPQDAVEGENIRNTRCRLTPHLTPHREESPNSQESNQRGKKDKTLQKIGDFLQSSPTFLGSKAKRIMGLMSGKSPDGGSTPSLKLKSKRDKRKYDRPDISSPMDIPAHRIIGRNPEDKESGNLIKKRLRTRMAK
ncbi:kinesin-like protein KIF20B isoform X2 [Danio rerio]|uniref:Kinesin-like protein KIF20B isoform X2 n=1 Tax=Danio rerio TaxID=7955 RepID=A0AC58HRJ2_DANRE